MNTRHINWHIVALISANMMWGAAVPIFKFALTNIPPFTLLFVRFSIASLFFLPLAVKYWQNITVKQLGEIVLAAFFGFSVAVSFLFMGLQKAPSINFPIIASAGPIVLYCLAVFIMKERPHSKILIGSFISLMGVLFIVLSPLIFSSSAAFSGSQIQGNLFFVITMIAHAIYVILTKTVLKKINVFQTTFIMFAIASISYSPFALRELGGWSFSQLNNAGMFGIIYGTIFSSAIAYCLYHWAIEKIDAQEIGIFTYLDPVTTITVAYLLLGEKPTSYYLLGAILVFFGIFVAEKRIHWHPLHRIKKILT